MSTTPINSFPQEVEVEVKLKFQVEDPEELAYANVDNPGFIADLFDVLGDGSGTVLISINGKSYTEIKKQLAESALIP